MNEMAENCDMEDEIPMNRIITAEALARNNFVEIIAEDDLDDAIEYVGYSDEECMYVEVEEEYQEEQTEEPNDTNTTTAAEQNHITLTEEENKNPDEENSEEMYHCSSCNVNFQSVMEHINRYHKNQSVLLDNAENNTDDDKNPDIFVKREPIEEGELIETANMEVAEIEYVEEEEVCSVDIIEHENLNDMRIARQEQIKTEDSHNVTNAEHKCNTCHEIYLNDDDFYNHGCFTEESTEQLPSESKCQRANMQSLYGCTECLQKFENEHLLSYHMQTESHNKRTEPKTTKYKRAPAVPVVCAICNTTFRSNKSYRLHARMHDPVKMKPIEEAIGYEMKSCSKDGKISTETYFCEICNKSYDTSFEDAHRKSHKNGLKHICTVCNKKFPSQINLEMHLSAHQDHAKIKTPTKAELNGISLPYACAYCGRQFARPHEKVKHERIHTGLKPFKCEICGKCFRVSYCLTLHLRTHTAARPYVCPHCNKRFKAYSAYNHHLMTHSDERPYKCPHCPKAFKTSVQLAGHKNSHTKPFSCPECNRPFASLYAVRAHMETHKRGSQNLKHRCLICGAIYARIFALKDHMKEQHQTSFVDGNEVTDLNISEVPFIDGNVISAESILPDNGEEITIGEIEHFQTEEVVTDWLK